MNHSVPVAYSLVALAFAWISGYICGAVKRCR
jgi:hypothetical protein